MLRRSLQALIPRRVWATLRSVRIELHHATYRKRVVTHSYFGQRLTVCVADGLAEGYYGQDVPELERLKIMSGRTPAPRAVRRILCSFSRPVGVSARVESSCPGAASSAMPCRKT